MGFESMKPQKKSLRGDVPVLRLVTSNFSAGCLPKIAIVIPAYNEEKNIESVLAEVHKVKQSHPNWVLLPIVVNDGSTDNTEKVLDQIESRYGAHAITLPLNLGIGRAVQTGFRYAVRLGADVTLQLDGDGQHPAEQIPAIVEPVLSGNADMIVGSRYAASAGGNVSTSLRQAGTWLFSMVLRLLVGIRVTDATSGFRAFNHECADFISKHYPDDYPEVETYVILTRSKFKISEVPVTMRPRRGGASSITPIRSVYYMIKVMFATAIDMIRPIPPRKNAGSR